MSFVCLRISLPIDEMHLHDFVMEIRDVSKTCEKKNAFFLFALRETCEVDHKTGAVFHNKAGLKTKLATSLTEMNTTVGMFLDNSRWNVPQDPDRPIAEFSNPLTKFADIVPNTTPITLVEKRGRPPGAMNKPKYTWSFLKMVGKHYTSPLTERGLMSRKQKNCDSVSGRSDAFDDMEGQNQMIGGIGPPCRQCALSLVFSGPW